MAKTKRVKTSYDEATNLVKNYWTYFAKKHEVDDTNSYAFKLGCAEAMLACLLAEQMTPEMYVKTLHKRMAEGT